MFSSFIHKEGEGILKMIELIIRLGRYSFLISPGIWKKKEKRWPQQETNFHYRMHFGKFIIVIFLSYVKYYKLKNN